MKTKKIEICQHLSLFLCYFWRKNCSKTWILAFWTTLVNACWPYVCDMTKYILGACKYLSQVPSPQISCPEMQNSSWGVEKTIFLCLTYNDGITTFISLFLHFNWIPNNQHMIQTTLAQSRKDWCKIALNLQRLVPASPKIRKFLHLRLKRMNMVKLSC